jgi:hypothetical protein
MTPVVGVPTVVKYQLGGSGNTNDGEEDVPKNDVVQKFIVLHRPILFRFLEDEAEWRSVLI